MSVDDQHGVSISNDGPYVRIGLDNPSRKNALGLSDVSAITTAIAAAEASDTTRVIVIGHSGPDFCSGMDLIESNANLEGVRPRTGHLQRRINAGAHRMITAVHEVQLPVVVGVRGWAAGVGNALALSGDHVIAGRSARFWVPFVARGFTPDSANSWLLPRLVGLARAKEMVMRARPIAADLALDWGLVAQVVDDDDVDDAVAEIAGHYAAAATLSVGLAKQLLHQNLEVGLHHALRNESVTEELAVRSLDFKEGMLAFTEKRPPNYRGG